MIGAPNPGNAFPPNDLQKTPHAERRSAADFKRRGAEAQRAQRIKKKPARAAID
ncbi:MAG: hypothetical protein QOE70_3632 [Chthoniobacter sp.]|jgi:hypothetical protein|nr:hypothetical protein [Chthoniobacter sp.]